MNVENVSRDDWILGGVALLLALDLLILPWWSIGPFSFAGTDGPAGFLGVLAVLSAIAVVADLAIERLSPQTTIPHLGGSRAETRLILALLVAVFGVLKFVIHTGFAGGVGFWVAIILTAALVYLALQARNAGATARPTRPTRPTTTV